MSAAHRGSPGLLARGRALVIAVALLALSGCPAGHDDYPTTACKIDSDCFLGETCLNNLCATINDLSQPPPIDFSQYDFKCIPSCPDLASVDGGGDDLSAADLMSGDL